MTRWCDLLERKAKKALTAFNGTVAALNKSLNYLESSSGRRTYLSRFNRRRFGRSIRDDQCLLELTGVRDLLENCQKTVDAKCETSTVKGCQNATQRTDCQIKLQDWINKFGPKGGSCLQDPNKEFCPCITALPDVSADCLSFDIKEKSVKDARKKCINGTEEGSFGFCKKLQVEAAILISKCETCTSEVNNSTQPTSTPGVITTTRKAVTSISGSEDKKLLDFKHKAALHFDEIVLNLTSTNTARHDCTASSCQLTLQECTVSKFLSCAQRLFQAILACALKFQGIVACMTQVLGAFQECIPCICKAIFIYFGKLPPGCIHCPGCPSVCADSWLVLTGGANIAQTKRLATSEVITSTGTCRPDVSNKQLQNLPVATAAGRSAWIDGGTLIYCGGSKTFQSFKPNTNTWGAVKSCYTTTPGAADWDNDNGNMDMTSARSFFTLTPFNYGELAAVGGIDASGAILSSIEIFSVATKRWSTSNSIELSSPRYGHCTISFSKEGESYLIIIGGSAQEPTQNGETVTVTPLATVTQVKMTDGALTTLRPLPSVIGNGLWSHACSILSGNIFVSGGSTGKLDEPKDRVHRYNIAGNTWSTSIGTLVKPRYGHIMNSIPGSTGYQLVVAGGAQEDDNESVESSQNDGVTWVQYSSELSDGRGFIGLAKVPVDTFTCQ